MENLPNFTPEAITDFVKFLDQNTSTDFLKANLLSNEVTSQLDFTLLTDKDDPRDQLQIQVGWQLYNLYKTNFTQDDLDKLLIKMGVK